MDTCRSSTTSQPQRTPTTLAALTLWLRQSPATATAAACCTPEAATRGAISEQSCDRQQGSAFDCEPEMPLSGWSTSFDGQLTLFS